MIYRNARHAGMRHMHRITSRSPRAAGWKGRGMAGPDQCLTDTRMACGREVYAVLRRQCLLDPMCF